MCFCRLTSLECLNVVCLAPRAAWGRVARGALSGVSSAPQLPLEVTEHELKRAEEVGMPSLCCSALKISDS